MRVYLRDIISQPLTIDEEIDPTTLDLSTGSYKIVAPLQLHAVIEKCGSTSVLADTKVHTRFSCQCARCLENIEKDIDEKFRMNIEIEQDSEYIDLGDAVRQEIILSLPQTMLCQENCKGICLGCGAHLNDESCRCKQEHKSTKTQEHKIKR